ncbi:hypothetical protein ACJX0J_024295, partial [Zea mays]
LSGLDKLFSVSLSRVIIQGNLLTQQLLDNMIRAVQGLGNIRMYLLSCRMYFFNIIKTRLLAGYLYICRCVRHNSLHIQRGKKFVLELLLRSRDTFLPPATRNGHVFHSLAMFITT